MTEARALLGQVFGFPDFRPGQGEIVAAVEARRDVLAIMPTGGGKSLCYQLPALTRGEGMLESAFHRYQPVRAESPTRPRSDHNPLDREEYLRRLAGRRALA